MVGQLNRAKDETKDDGYAGHATFKARRRDWKEQRKCNVIGDIVMLGFCIEEFHGVGDVCGVTETVFADAFYIVVWRL